MQELSSVASSQAWLPTNSDCNGVLSILISQRMIVSHSFNTLAIALTGATILIFCWIAVNTPAGLVVWTVLYGFCSGAFIALLPACVIKFCPDATKFGGRSGILFGIVGIPALCGPPIAGALITHDNGGYRDLIIYSGVVSAVGTAMYWLVRFRNAPGLFAKF